LVAIQILPEIDRLGLCTRKLLTVVSVFPSLSFFLESTMALTSSGKALCLWRSLRLVDSVSVDTYGS